jgi:hypothetical protein
MTSASRSVDEPQALAAVRRFLLATILLGVAAMDVELLLLGHVEGFGQLAPVVLLACGLAVLVWHAITPRAATVRAVQLVMMLFVVSGVAGIVLHYRGNAEFELEMYPSLGGTELIGKTLTGATPVLAPGSMALLGLAGLVHAYQHPRRRAGGGHQEEGS